MRVSREQATENRERVLDTAAKLFRERGFSSVGIAEVMKAAGLTHGGFYGQFESKEDLMVQACTRAFRGSLERWREAAVRSPDKPLSAVVASYVSTAHRDNPGDGCVVAALGGEAAREGPALRRVITDGAKSLLEILNSTMPARSRVEKRQRAAATLACMVGAVVLARTLDDESLSKEILRAVRAAASHFSS